MRMGITGAFLVTPASFSWNLYAERIAPGTSWRAIVTKLGVSIAVLPPMVRERDARAERQLLFFIADLPVFAAVVDRGGYDTDFNLLPLLVRAV